jgi:hypothetical protein
MARDKRRQLQTANRAVPTDVDRHATSVPVRQVRQERHNPRPQADQRRVLALRRVRGPEEGIEGMNAGRYRLDPNSIRQRVEDLLIEHGGMTLSDLLEELPGRSKGGVSKVICDMREAGTVYIKAWVRDQPGQKRHLRPVWDHVANSKRRSPKDKARPMPISNAVRLRRRRVERKGMAPRTNFIFTVAGTAAERINE